MKLVKVKIKNFRSIKDLTVDFKENPRVLVGINEAGKTNILESLRLLSPEFSPQREDVRQTSKGVADESLISFVFEFNEKEKKNIYEEVKKEVLLDDLSKPIVKLKDREKKCNLLEVCKMQVGGVYDIDVKKGDRSSKYYTFTEDIKKFIIEFKRPKPGSNFVFQNKNGETLNLANLKLVDYEDYKDVIPQEYLEDAELKDLENIIGTKIVNTIETNLPSVVYWVYKEENLLKPVVPIETFATTPASYKPLRNLFILSGIPQDKISEKINEAKEAGENAFITLLENISKHATQEFRKAWPEYKHVKFSIRPNGNNISCGIQGEKTIQDSKLRSEGFKRFVTILLLLSIPAKKGLLKNSLILVDEADSALHPSGCRYLMKQLKDIAENNYVMYSTHSIFMVDRDDIPRHYIVKESGEITTVEEATADNYISEEVLYKALGASVFEALKEKNIVFEGWTDENLFRVFLQNKKKFKQDFNNVGIGHAGGVSHFKDVAPILELGNRKVLFMSDGDEPAQQAQKNFEDKKLYGIWKKYDEIFQERKIVTCEDFIKREILVKNLKRLNIELGLNIKLDENFQLPETGRLNYIKNQLIKKDITDDSLRRFIKKFKEKLFSNLKIKDIENDYFDFIKNLKETIEKL